MINFGTVLTAMVTPFKKDGSVDFVAAEKLAVHLAENGTETLVIHGTTGESPTLTHDEEYELYKVIKKAVAGKAKVIAGTGSNSTATAIKSTKEAEAIGVDGSMIVVPYYNKPSQEGMYQHFKAVAESTKLPVMIYNIPGRSAVNMLPDTVARLAKIKNIVSIKEASGNMDQVAEIRKKTPKDFIIYSGDDDKTLSIMERGGIGVVSVASHVAGKEISEMCKLFQQGKKDEARKIHGKLSPLFKVLFIAPNPAPVKYALELTGMPVGGVRLPLVVVNDSERSQIKKSFRRVKTYLNHLMKKILLHACCAPCSTAVLRKLRSESFAVSGLFYNPNIHPECEMDQRMEAFKKYSAEENFNAIIDDLYDIDLFVREVVNKEGDRCLNCYRMRLDRTAYCAKENNFDYFSTTISISPYQKLDLIRQAGEEMSKKHGIDFYYQDFTPLYRESIDLSKGMGLYRQKYCGCYLSIEENNVER